MTTPTHHRNRKRAAAAIVGTIVGLIIGLFVIGPLVDDAEAHVPRPVACQLAWEAAPAGEKWQAKQRCVAGQRNHVRKHRVAAQVAKARRTCLRVGWQLGSKMCHAIAVVKPAWAGRWAYHELLDRESDGSTNAVNEGSGACGAFQRLKCPWRYYGGTASPADDRVYSDAMTQTRNGVRYIVGRYGSPEAAVRFHNANGWY